MSRLRRTRSIVGAICIALAYPTAIPARADAAAPPLRVAVMANRQLAVVRGDGTGFRNIGKYPIDISRHAWSSGSRVLYLSDNPRRGMASGVVPRWELRIADLRRGRDTAVRAFDLPFAPPVAVAWIDPPVWSPNGKRAAFVVWSGMCAPLWGGPCAFSSEIFVVEVDGAELTPIAQGINGSEPTWAPDSRRLAFTRAGIEVIDVDDPTVQRRVSPVDVAAYAPVWSPDGRRVAFLGTRLLLGRSRIWIATADGARVRELSAETTEPPSWSPDGWWLAYSPSRLNTLSSTGHWRTGIVIVSRDGKRVRRITPKPNPESFEGAPQWSRSGQIVYVRTNREWGSSIMVVDPSTKKRREILFTYDAYPRFALSR
jgi:Tol biopolymer transport system component